MAKVDKRHPVNRYEKSADLSKFYIWRIFDDSYDTPMDVPEAYTTTSTFTFKPKEVVRAFGFPIPARTHFILSTGLFSIATLSVHNLKNFETRTSKSIF